MGKKVSGPPNESSFGAKSPSEPSMSVPSPRRTPSSPGGGSPLTSAQIESLSCDLSDSLAVANSLPLTSQECEGLKRCLIQLSSGKGTEETRDRARWQLTQVLTHLPPHSPQRSGCDFLMRFIDGCRILPKSEPRHT